MKVIIDLSVDMTSVGLQWYSIQSHCILYPSASVQHQIAHWRGIFEEIPPKSNPAQTERMLRSRVLAGITYPGPQSWKRGADLNSSPWLLFTFLLTIVVQLLLRQAGGITIYLIVSPCYGLPHPISLCPGVLIVINSLPVYRVKSGKFYNLCKEKENTI